MKCKHLKIRTKKGIKYGYCTLLKKEVSFYCKDCSNLEYKTYNTIKKVSKTHSKRDLKRFSIIYQDMNKCALCGINGGIFDTRINMVNHIDKNEVFSGAYRTHSIEDGLVVPLCTYCHKKFHLDRELNLFYKKLFQKEYLKNHTLEEFIKRYGKNYIKKED